MGAYSITTAANTNYLRTSASQSNLGTATSLCGKIKLNGTAILSAGTSFSGTKVLLEVGAITSTSTAKRLGVHIIDDGATDMQIGVQIQGNNATHTFTRASITAGSDYIIYFHVGTGEGLVFYLYNATTSTVVWTETNTNWDTTFGASSTANGKVCVGAGLVAGATTGFVGSMDGVALYSGEKAAGDRYTDPDTDTTNLLWYCPFKEGSGTSAANEVVSATALDTWNGSISWTSGGVWDGAASGGGVSATPGVGTLSWTGRAPTISNTAHVSLTPGVGTLSFTGSVPIVTVSSPTMVSPGAGTLTLSSFAPTSTTTANVVVEPGTGTLTFTGHTIQIAELIGTYIYSFLRRLRRWRKR